MQKGEGCSRIKDGNARLVDEEDELEVRGEKIIKGKVVASNEVTG